MNKLGVVFGVAALAVVAGCKDPNYVKRSGKAQDEVKNVPAEQTTPVEVTPDVTPVEEQPTEVVVEEQQPAPEEVKPAEPAPAPAEPEPVYTTYIVQRGDYLAKISKKFNVTLAALRKANPQIKDDNKVLLGQKIKIPGQHDVGEQTVPEGALAKPAPKPAAPAAYTGATEDYVVKSGDTLGGIAYSRGINIRQLKELNGLSKDTLRIGQKLKIPAEKAVAAKAPAAAEKKVEAAKPAAPAAEAAPAEEKDDKPLDAAALADEVAKATTAAPDASTSASAASAASPATYVVQEGDDMTGVSIRWGVSAAEIRELNNLGEKDQLVPGQIIKLPADAQQ